MKTPRPLLLFTWAIYCFATLRFVRNYILLTTPYLVLPSYLLGHERLPFQERVLPIVVYRAFYAFPPIANHLHHDTGLFTWENGPMFFLSLVATVVAGTFAYKLYRAVSPQGSLAVVVYPVFLFTVMMTYSAHPDQNFNFPYDLLSVAFFTAGLYFIYTRRYVPLLAVILVGTFNRETTLFLIIVFCLDAASSQDAHAEQPDGLRQRFELGQVPWLKVALLSAAWLAVKLPLAHTFRFNDRSEYFLRLHYNISTFRPGYIPTMFDLCGYLLPVVFVLRKRIRPVRFGNYAYILPVWLAVMCCTGVLIEIRIYGELCAFAAVAAVLLLEEQIASHGVSRSRVERQQV